MRINAIYLAVALSLAASASSAAPWTYRGSLNDGGQPANGRYDIRVSLLSEGVDASITSPITLHNVAIKNGQFAVDVDFGIDLANAPVMRLKTEVQQGGSGFVAMGEPTRFDAKAALGTVCWDTSGNAGTNPTNDFIGTTDAQAFVVRTQNAQSLRIEPSVAQSSGGPDSANIIAGGRTNSVLPGAQGVTISGGGAVSDEGIPGGSSNRAYDSFGTIGGGIGNEVGESGLSPLAQGYSTVSGGRGNHATGQTSAIAGGNLNKAQGATSSVVGGSQNEAFGGLSTVSGGSNNCAGGRWSWAGGNAVQIRPGQEAETTDCNAVPRTPGFGGDVGSFVWGGDSGLSFRTTGATQFGVRANGIFFGTREARFLTIPASQFISTSSGAHLTTGGTWTNASSRSLKTAFEAIDPMAVLGKVVSLPLSTWSYKESVEGRHLGPVAEDFKALFGLGGDGKSIATVDADGVALAAIQGLNQKLDDENAVLKAALAAVEARLSALESSR